jgi:ABC-type polysaccharide/polyol phosphate export permease
VISLPALEAPRPTPLAEVWRFRELMRQLVVRNLKVRYQRSVLGFLWALLNPLATIAILVAVFGYVVRIGVPDYWAFLVSGYFAWVFVLHTLNASASVITDHAYMVKSVAVPAELLVLSGAVARLVEFIAEMALVLVVLALWHHGAVPASFALLPLLAALRGMGLLAF